MEDFLEFFDQLTEGFPLHMEIYHSKVLDWCIVITKKGCAEDYPTAEHDGTDVVLVEVQHIDMKYCFAKAHVDLKEWLMEYNGGY